MSDELPLRPILLTKPLEIDSDYLGHSDVTVFIKAEDFRSKLFEASRTSRWDRRLKQEIDQRHSFDIQGQIRAMGNEKSLRIHAALSFGGAFYSVTMRSPPKSSVSWDDTTWRGSVGDWRKLAPSLGLGLMFNDRANQLSDGWLDCWSYVAETIYHGIFAEQAYPAAGLVLITGETGSGKTNILNALLAQYLAALLNRGGLKRRPHIVAIGDPIETIFFQDGASDQLLHSGDLQRIGVRSLPIDYTGRIIGVDTPSVGEALVDALRETPCTYIVSELRKDADFKAALRFASTGHLILATAHNTSLVDALGNLMTIHEAGNPSGRASLAQRLKAVVHLARLEIDESVQEPDKPAHTRKLGIVLPTIWRGNHPGVRNFVCDGLASLLPRGVPKFPGGDIEGPGVLGLAWTAERLGDRWNLTEDSKRKASLVRRAHQKDLQIR